MVRFYDTAKYEKLCLADNVNYCEEHLREEVSFQTYDLEVFYDCYNKGWTFKKLSEGFLMRAPETWLVDLTDPYKVIYYKDVITNLAYYNFLTDLIKCDTLNSFIARTIERYDLKNLEIIVLKGESLESEIRIAGTNSLILKLKELLFIEAKNNSLWPHYFAQASALLKGSENISFTKLNIHDAPVETRSFFYNLSDYYAPHDMFKKNAWNNLYIPDIFKDIPEADVYLFIPWGCFSYISSFINADNISKVMFWEAHSGKDRSHKNRYLAKDLKGKKVLIIDNSYSGSTLNQMSKIVKKEGGIPIRLALFPKSRFSVENSEYILFIDEILESSSIDLSKKDWLKDTYKKILLEKN